MKHTCADKQGKRGATWQEEQNGLNEGGSSDFICEAFLCNKATYMYEWGCQGGTARNTAAEENTNFYFYFIFLCVCDFSYPVTYRSHQSVVTLLWAGTGEVNFPP